MFMLRFKEIFYIVEALHHSFLSSELCITRHGPADCSHLFPVISLHEIGHLNPSQNSLIYLIQPSLYKYTKPTLIIHHFTTSTPPSKFTRAI